MSQQTVLVTGGCGYIGSHVLRNLAEAKIKAVVLDDLSSGTREALLNGEQLYVGSVGDEALVKRILTIHKIDAVLHFAASIRVDESVREPAIYYNNNTVNTLRFISSIVAGGVRRMVFSSTAAVYGQFAKMPLKEDTHAQPESPYGASKLMSERMLIDIAAAKGLNFVILRYFNVAGADPEARIGQRSKDATHLIKVACEVATGKRSQITVFGSDYPTPDGTCIRDYIHIEDLAMAHLKALTHLTTAAKSDLILNCGYGHGSSVREVLKAVKKASSVDIKIVDGPRRAGDVPEVVADAQKLRKLLGWEPRYDNLDTIVGHAYAWERRMREKEAKG